MRGVGTWELEGGGNVLGLRVGSFFERREAIRRNERCGSLVEWTLLGDERRFLEYWRHLLGRSDFIEGHSFLLWLFRRDLRRFRTDDRLLGNNVKFPHSARLLP
jgi:hypothetical protein